MVRDRTALHLNDRGGQIFQKRELNFQRAPSDRLPTHSAVPVLPPFAHCAALASSFWLCPMQPKDRSTSSLGLTGTAEDASWKWQRGRTYGEPKTMKNSTVLIVTMLALSGYRRFAEDLPAQPGYVSTRSRLSMAVLRHR